MGMAYGQRSIPVAVCLVPKTRINNIGIYHPLSAPLRLGKVEDGFNGIMRAAPWSEAIAARLEPGFPLWLERVLHPRLHGAVRNRCDTKRAKFSILLRDIH